MADEKIVIVNSKFNSIILFISVILILTLLVFGYFAWKSIKDENSRLVNEVTEFKKLTDTLIRGSNKWVDKDELNNELKKLLTKNDLQALEKDLKTLNSKLFAVGQTVGKLDKKISEREGSDSKGPDNEIEKCEDGRLIDIHRYTKNPQIKDIKDKNEATIAKVEFNASLVKPWSYEVFKRNYRLINVVGKKDSGQLTFYNKLEYSIGNSKYFPVSLISSDYIQSKIGKGMYWLNPILDLNFFVGGKAHTFAEGFGRDNLFSMGVDLGLSLSSYGETKVDSLFRMFRFGLGYDIERQAARVSFSPITLNVGYYLPLLTNLYISPQVGIDTGGGLL